ncbi:MAG TPA: hypothetical protein VN830_04820 [Verrucomicrobiae bacterium]|nr:hypothetical protein [Verrucomicrobiae bacterium]
MRRICEFLFILTFVLSIAGCSGLSDVPNGGGGQVTSVTVSPATASVAPFTTQAFTANQSVTWQVNGVTGGSATTGIISAAGLYTAPHSIAASLVPATNAPITVTITGISQANAAATGTAIVTLTTQQQQTQTEPIELGTSGGISNDANGNYCCSGTLGALVTRSGTQYILSNNHVMANSAGNAGSADVGVAITQPGLIEVNCVSSSTHTVANLSEYFPLETGPIPKIDAALAAVTNGAVDNSGNILLLGSTLTNGVPVPGAPKSGIGLTPAQAIVAPYNGAVAKSGRTTGLTCSTILGTNVASSVDYYAHCGDTNASFTVNYTDLVAVNGGDFSDTGDSGSLIVTQSTAEAVALLFAGSDTDTVGNPITDVLPDFPGAGNATPTIVGGATHQVIGCTVPALKAVTTVPQVQAVAESIQQASAVRDLHAPQLLSIPAIKAVAVGESYDQPGKASILLFVGSGESLAGIPRTIDGVRTRLIEGSDWAHHGLLNSEESANLLSTVGRPQIVYPLQQGEYLRAKTVHSAHVTQLLKQAGILGVGITSSIDAPGEAALLIYVLRGASQDNIPAEIDGLRTRVRETSPFTTGRRGNEPARSCKMPVAKTVLTKTNP